VPYSDSFKWRQKLAKNEWVRQRGRDLLRKAGRERECQLEGDRYNSLSVRPKKKALFSLWTISFFSLSILKCVYHIGALWPAIKESLVL